LESRGPALYHPADIPRHAAPLAVGPMLAALNARRIEFVEHRLMSRPVEEILPWSAA
jgi:hypothetical protein